MTISSRQSFEYHLRSDNMILPYHKGISEVENIYHHGFTCMMDQQRLYITTHEASLHQFSILLPKEATIQIYEGEQIEIEEKVFSIGATHFTRSEDIEPPKITIGDRAILKQNSLTAKNAMISIAEKSEIGRIILHRETNQLSAKVDSLLSKLASQQLDLSLFTTTFGAGKGLTPAFDDLCAGILFCDRAFKKDRVIAEDYFLTVVKTRTTISSWQQLLIASKGKFNLLFERLLSDMCERPLPAAHFLSPLSFGHTSGCDILCGICKYIDACV